MGWRVRAARGATTVESNTPTAIAEAVRELMERLVEANQLVPEEIISVIFTVTPDVNAAFPAATARQQPGWERVPLLDMVGMMVPGSPERCIRVLIQFNTEKSQAEIQHIYLRQAQYLRPDLVMSA
ncbi:MAG: chorismate mutase [Thermostichales cyanobacterium BF4_bins_65]